VLSASLGYITASGRADSSSSYYVINKSTVAAASGNSVAAGAYYLGRPWGAFARVAFQSCTLSNVINAAGWRVWNEGDERTSNVEFGEYSNTGDGASGQRASFSKKLSSAVKIESVLGSGYASASWVDAAYL
jgi:pectinesterase